ncbi:hypothetical protein [Blastococcus sp. SYSU DS0973]
MRRLLPWVTGATGAALLVAEVLVFPALGSGLLGRTSGRRQGRSPV